MSKIPPSVFTPFEKESGERIAAYKTKSEWHKLSSDWMMEAFNNKYMYNFFFLGRPIIQIPTDMVSIQQLIWEVKPDLIIESGIAHGGSLIMNAAMLALLDYCDAVEKNQLLDPKKPKRRILGIDIDIRQHNRKAIETHPMAGYIDMLEGSSVAPKIIEQVKNYTSAYSNILVILDSNHTHEHVLAELEAYAPLVSKNSYCIVLDTIVEDLPSGIFPNRPWDKGNNPKTAVWEYMDLLKKEGRTGQDGLSLYFEIDKIAENKLLLTVAPDGYLKRV